MANVGGADVVIAAAVSQLGKPYSWDTPASATDPNPRTFDCSGLTMWCYRKAGITLGHQTNLQYHALKHRPLSEAAPGDLIFFGTLVDFYHVALYIGDSTIIEAPDYGIPVRRRTISPRSTGIWNQVGVFPGTSSTHGGAAPVTYQQFFSQVLTQLGLPVTQANLRALARVSIIEGTNDRWNPLNSVVPVAGSTAFNSVGVQDYGNYQNGVAGTVKLLTGSAWNSVVSALRLGNSEGGVINAFANTYSGWGSHPAFGNVSDSQADSLLTQSLGTATAITYPYPTRKRGANKTFADAHYDIQIGGKWYLDIQAGYGHSDIGAKLEKIPDSAITKIAKWNVAHDSSSETARSKAWIAGTRKGVDGQSLKFGVLGDYAGIYDKTFTTDNTGIPNLSPENLLDWAGQLTKLLSWLTTAKNWERIGLFALGAVILIFAAYEIAR